MEAVISAIWHRLRHCVNLSGTHRDKPMGKKVEEPNQARSEEDPYEDDSNLIVGARMFNSDPLDALELRQPVLGKVMEALADPNTHLIGIYSSHDEIKDTLLQTVNRRIQRENLFDMVLTGNVTRKPHVNKIQDELAHQLGLTLHPKSKDRRVNELIHRIKNEQKILIVLRDLHKGLDLSKVGIPYGSDHTGCKILLTSTNEDVLSNHMHTQKNFMI